MHRPPRPSVCLLLPFLVALPLYAASVPLDKASDLEGWKLEHGTWRVQDGALVQSDAALNYAIAWLPTTAYSDLDMAVEFLVHPEGRGVRAPGLVFHAVGMQTLYYIHFDVRNQNVLWVRSTPARRGTDVRRHKCRRLKTGEWMTARLVVSGAEHHVYLDGKLLFTETDATLKAGVVGLRTGQGKIAFRNFRLAGTEAALDPPFAFEAPPPPPPDPPRGAFGIVCSDAGAGAYEAFPDVRRTKSGELLCVFYAGYGHVSVPNARLPQGARIALCRSTDEGRTWSRPTVVVDTPIDDRDPSIVELPNGDLLVAFMTYDPKRKGDTHHSFTARSTDGGRTWGEPRRIPTPFTQLVAVSTPPRLMPDGRLLLTPYGNNTGDPRRYKHAAVLESRDNGHTWATLAEIKSDKHLLLEPDVVRLPDGKLFLMMRAVMTWSESTDGGRTWSDPKPLGIKGDCPYLLLTSKDILLCGFRSRELRSTCVIYSTDFAKTWSRPVIIDRVVGAYPSFAELPDGRILAVYYTEGKGSDVRCAWLRADGAGVRVLPREAQRKRSGRTERRGGRLLSPGLNETRDVTGTSSIVAADREISNHKHQIPNKLQAPNPNDPNHRTRRRVTVLGIGCLRFAALVIPPHRRARGRRPSRRRPPRPSGRRHPRRQEGRQGLLARAVCGRERRRRGRAGAELRRARARGQRPPGPRGRAKLPLSRRSPQICPHH